jgi:hypothetical protein
MDGNMSLLELSKEEVSRTWRYFHCSETLLDIVVDVYFTELGYGSNKIFIAVTFDLF